MHRLTAVVVFALCLVSLKAQNDLYFPQIAVGGGYETVLQVLNEENVTETITVEVFEGISSETDNGSPLAVKFDGGTPVSSLVQTLNPYQEFSTLLSSSDTSLHVGWLRVHSSVAGGKIGANLFFRTKSGNTVIDSVGVLASQGLRFGLLQVDNRAAGSDTGVAFANPTDSAVDVLIDLFQGPDFIGRQTVTLQPSQQSAKFVTELFPGFGQQQGTLLVETPPGTILPFLGVRVDGTQVTSLPFHPYGFSLQYEIHDAADTSLETGYWVFDSDGLSLIGKGKADGGTTMYDVTGNWTGHSFQCAFRRTFTDQTVGMVVFNGTSQGQETSDDVPITGTATTIGADGQVVSVNNFSASVKFP